jgi:hypothetical protein
LSNAKVGYKYIVFLVDPTATVGLNQPNARTAAAPTIPDTTRYEMLKVGQTGTAALRLNSGKVEAEAPELQLEYQGKDAQAVFADIAKFAPTQK